MKLNKRKHRTVVAMNMTPMIDIVFLLLIFFMTVSQVSEASKEHVELARQKGDTKTRQHHVVINVLYPDGDIKVNGQVMQFDELYAHLRKEIDRIGDVALIDVQLRADRRLDAKEPNAVLSRIASLGITKVNIAVAAPN